VTSIDASTIMKEQTSGNLELEGTKAIRFYYQRWAFNEIQVHYFKLVQ